MNELREKLVKGMLDIVMLRIIADQPTHGYKIIKTIQQRYDLYFGPSTIYPMLNVLEKEGYVKSQWEFPSSKHKFGKPTDKPCKTYTITLKGKTRLGCGQTELETIVKPLIQVRANA